MKRPQNDSDVSFLPLFNNIELHVCLQQHHYRTENNDRDPSLHLSIDVAFHRGPRLVKVSHCSTVFAQNYLHTNSDAS